MSAWTAISTCVALSPKVYLIDTNVISEARKGRRADAGVQAFWAEAVDKDIYLPAQVIGAIRAGVERIARRGDSKQAAKLADWLDQVVTQYADKILIFDTDCAQIWGALMAKGPQNPIDKQIAAIALLYDLTVVTRNARDFTKLGVKLHNPSA